MYDQAVKLLQRGVWVWLTVVVCLPAAEPVDFARDVRPILSDRCFACHGPDEPSRKVGLRLDTEAGAKSDLGGHFALVAGSVTQSELIRRVTSVRRGRQTGSGLPSPPIAIRCGPRARTRPCPVRLRSSHRNTSVSTSYIEMDPGFDGSARRRKLPEHRTGRLTDRISSFGAAIRVRSAVVG